MALKILLVVRGGNLRGYLGEGVSVLGGIQRQPDGRTAAFRGESKVDRLLAICVAAHPQEPPQGVLTRYLLSALITAIILIDSYVKPGVQAIANCQLLYVQR